MIIDPVFYNQCISISSNPISFQVIIVHTKNIHPMLLSSLMLLNSLEGKYGVIPNYTNWKTGRCVCCNIGRKRTCFC